jgi:hypothetical protein
LYVRAGSVIPQQPDMAFIGEKPSDSLLIDIYGPENASFDLYEDDGVSRDYEKGLSAWTPIRFGHLGGVNIRLTIGPTNGRFAGQIEHRGLSVRIFGITRPAGVAVDGKKIVMGGGGVDSWSWDERTASMTLSLGRKSIRIARSVEFR